VCAAAVLFSHAVVAIDVAKAPDSVRRKCVKPAAEAVSLSSTLASACAVIGRKKNGDQADQHQRHGNLHVDV
jgi:hypothetical protein